MTVSIILLTLGIISITLAFFLSAFRQNEKQDAVISKYLLSDFEKGKIRIQKTVLPDKRLTKNAWYNYINSLRNGKI